MAKKSYVGASSIAREVKNGYIGVSGVARKIKKAYIGVDGVARLCWRGEKNIPLCFTANTAGSTIGMTVVGTGTPTRTVSFEYSTDNTTWNTFTVGSTVITLANAGNKVYFRGNNPNGVSEFLFYYAFVMTGSIAASGNIMSLVDTTCESLTIPCDYCFCDIFKGCTSLTTAPVLPATTLTPYCYSSMFSECTSLTTAPELPATILTNYCYYSMFFNCTSLTTAPQLPSTALATYCYGNMFSYCASLITAPALPATTTARGCYNAMFKYTSLTTAPELPATVLESFCYATMFEGCTSLTTVPELPATTLASYCYTRMFYGCTSLYVSDESISGTCDKVWTIPADGTFENTYSQSGMFTDCLGNRSSNNMAGAQGQSYTYYTQNQPL